MTSKTTNSTTKRRRLLQWAQRNMKYMMHFLGPLTSRAHIHHFFVSFFAGLSDTTEETSNIKFSGSFFSWSFWYYRRIVNNQVFRPDNLIFEVYSVASERPAKNNISEWGRPNGLFHSWARWGWGPGGDREYSVCLCVCLSGGWVAGGPAATHPQRKP